MLVSHLYCKSFVVFWINICIAVCPVSLRIEQLALALSLGTAICEACTFKLQKLLKLAGVERPSIDFVLGGGASHVLGVMREGCSLPGLPLNCAILKLVLAHSEQPRLLGTLTLLLRTPSGVRKQTQARCTLPNIALW